jgi:hypothetical protein
MSGLLLASLLVMACAPASRCQRRPVRRRAHRRSAAKPNHRASRPRQRPHPRQQQRRQWPSRQHSPPRAAGAHRGRRNRRSRAARVSNQAHVKVRATIWVPQAEQDALDKMVAEYQKSNPNSRSRVDQHHRRRTVRSRQVADHARHGDAPDMMMLNTSQFEARCARRACAHSTTSSSQDKLDTSQYWPAGLTA